MGAVFHSCTAFVKRSMCGKKSMSNEGSLKGPSLKKAAASGGGPVAAGISFCQKGLLFEPASEQICEHALRLFKAVYVPLKCMGKCVCHEHAEGGYGHEEAVPSASVACTKPAKVPEGLILR